MAWGGNPYCMQKETPSQSWQPQVKSGKPDCKGPPLKCTLQRGLGLEAQRSFGVRFREFHYSPGVLAGWSWVRDVPSLSAHLLTHTQGIILPTGGVVWIKECEEVGRLEPYLRRCSVTVRTVPPPSGAEWACPLFPPRDCT